MRYLCSTFGSAGDVFPMLGLALELRGLGHEVTLSTNGHFEELVRRHGLDFEPLGTAADFDATIRNPDLWDPMKSFSTVFQSFQPLLKRQFEIHAEHAARGPVVAVANCLAFGARIAQDALRIPLVTVHLQPAVIWSDAAPPRLPGVKGPRWLKGLLYRFAEWMYIDPVVTPFLNGWRKELGLGPVRKITRWWHSPHQLVCLFPDWYAPPQRDWPQPFVQTSFPLWNDASAAGLPPEVARFLDAGDPPVVFTPGSANVHGQAFFASAVAACQTLRRRGILLTKFAEQIPANLPAEVLHVPYVPLDQLLPRAATFVHHGGVGSTAEGLAAGLPQILMPLAHDQFDNAARVERLGVGRSLPAARFNAARLTRLLDELLSSPAALAASRSLAPRLQARDGLRRTAEAIIARSG